MSDFVTLLFDHLPEVFSFLVSVSSFALVWYKTKNFNTAIKSYKEVLEDMKTGNVYAQDFKDARYKTQYHYNASKNELEELPTKIDIQAEIQSHLDTCLERVLERFLPPVGDTVDEVAVSKANISKLDEMLQLTDKANKYREQFNLSDSLSISEVFAEVQKKATAMKNELSLALSNLEAQNEKKEDK